VETLFSIQEVLDLLFRSDRRPKGMCRPSSAPISRYAPSVSSQPPRPVRGRASSRSTRRTHGHLEDRHAVHSWFPVQQFDAIEAVSPPTHRPLT